MTVKAQLEERAGNICELCSSSTGLAVYEIHPGEGMSADTSILICDKCRQQIEKKEASDPAHWACLTTAMWSEVPAVKVMAWRMLTRLRNETWAAEAVDMMYLTDDELTWAKAAGDEESGSEVDLHLDSNGNVLQNGDTVVLTKSLDVKGSTLNAKLGTVVKNIRLVAANSEQIEGRVEGQLIVILTKYLRKQGG